MSGVALVTGATGQDGSYLTEHLARDGYVVHAVVKSDERRSAVPSAAHHVHVLDLADPVAVGAVVAMVEPSAIFNLAGVSSVAQSWVDPVATAAVTGLSVLALLEAAWTLQERRGHPVRFVQASSAEVFGHPATSPQTELTPVRPVSPYGAAKAFAQHCVDVYRGRGLPASSLILYNHESPRRPLTFVTRKITAAVARISLDGGGTLVLGNLEARRDWAWAPDVVDVFARAALAEPGNYIVATGEAHSVRDFVVAAFDHVGIDDWQAHVRVDPALLRPADPHTLVGDARVAREVLGWAPTKTFSEIVAALVDTDLQIAREQQRLA